MTDFDTADAQPAPDAATQLTPMDSGSPGPRLSLVRKLVDIVVLPSGRISSNERALVADILLQVVEKVELSIRIELATRVAHITECPPALLRILLLDVPEVATQILEHAIAVPEALLIETAHTGTMQHRLLIARRRDLSSSVVDALVHYGEVEVSRVILKRSTCVLPPSATNTLVAQSASVPDLQPLLLRRSELEPAHGFTMFWWVDAAQRRRVLTRFALDRSLIQDALESLYELAFRSHEPDEMVKEILMFAERRHRPRGADGEPVSMSVIARTVSASRQEASREIIDAIALIGGISRELSARIVHDPGGEPLAVMCKSLGMPRDDFFALLQVPVGDEPADEEKAEYLLGVFDSMARDFCRAVLRYWDWNGNPRIAHIQQLITKAEDEGRNISF